MNRPKRLDGEAKNNRVTTFYIDPDLRAEANALLKKYRFSMSNFIDTIFSMIIKRPELIEVIARGVEE